MAPGKTRIRDRVYEKKRLYQGIGCCHGWFLDQHEPTRSYVDGDRCRQSQGTR